MARKRGSIEWVQLTEIAKDYAGDPDLDGVEIGFRHVGMDRAVRYSVEAQGIIRREWLRRAKEEAAAGIPAGSIDPETLEGGVSQEGWEEKLALDKRVLLEEFDAGASILVGIRGPGYGDFPGTVEALRDEMDRLFLWPGAIDRGMEVQNPAVPFRAAHASARLDGSEDNAEVASAGRGGS